MKIYAAQEPRREQIYWLSRAEAKDEAIIDFIHHDMKLKKDQNILPVIVESGSGELEKSLYLLMKRHADSDAVNLEKVS